MSTTTNYYQRSIDLNVFQGIKSSGCVTVNQTLLDNGGEICTGIQKLIQRWLIKFLTPLGSVKFHPQWGTTFLEEASGFFSEIDAQISFYNANADACDQLKEEEDDEMTLDEKIDSVELEEIVVNDTGFVLKIRLTSQFGQSAPVILPLAMNPLQI